MAEGTGGAGNQLAYVRKILINTYLADRRRKRLLESTFDQVVDTLPHGNAGSTFPEQDAMLRAIASLSRREQVVLVLLRDSPHLLPDDGPVRSE